MKANPKLTNYMFFPIPGTGFGMTEQHHIERRALLTYQDAAEHAEAMLAHHEGRYVRILITKVTLVGTIHLDGSITRPKQKKTLNSLSMGLE